MMRISHILICLFLAATPAVANFNPFDKAGIDQKENAHVPMDRVFTDAGGEPVTLGQLGGGKPIVLVPVLHHCLNICGVTLGGLMSAIEAQAFKPGEDFVLVAFGIDPDEGPAAARDDLDALRKRFPDMSFEGIHALTGDQKPVFEAMDALGYRYGYDETIEQYAHVAATAVLTSDGTLSRWLYGLSPQPNDLKLALTEAGRGEIGNWTDQLLLLCYHYDPVTGQYGSIVQIALKVSGGLFVVGAGSLIGFALMRERRKTKGSKA
ncbi:SCO family protein [Rhizobium sp. L1K21]|uniref:SCO family protein n=1 Tax=Rhizobium sp. L1K21 TaxID=2954933 RepID=UPI00209381C0|nr:SCO family protein [Rhizobium sp. L1K21]MCO6187781.1 SCO family protein [Rhizobium sp. L1K21]